MCLPIDPDHYLAQGTHAGHEWVVVHNGNGYRCGYVKVEPGHPWHGIGYDDIRLPDGEWPDVHGGLTFSEPDEPCDKGGEDAGWWLGFDCAHSGDLKDPSLPNERPARVYPSWDELDSRIRTTEYVEAECRKLAEQASLA